jgi:hypothetical protein
MSSSYRWPTKIKKFGIEDPFLRFVVAKYENEIPWGKTVNSEATLAAHVEEVMLPRLLDRVAFPPKVGVKHFYVSARDVNLELALSTDMELDQSEIEIVRLIRDEDGTEEAIRALVQVVNERKSVAFEQWSKLVGSDHLENRAFTLLLLKPLFDMAGRGARRSVVPPSTDVIEWLTRRIISGRLSPNDNVAQVYCWKLASGSSHVPENGWQYIPSGYENAAELSAASRGSGWCVASIEWARDYIRRSAFYILHSRGKPVVALRSDPTGMKIVECEGRYNNHPSGWCVDIVFFLRTQAIELRHRNNAVREEVLSMGDLDDQSAEWWKDRLRYWPFASQLLPQALVDITFNDYRSEVTSYLNFPSFGSLAEKAGVVLNPSDWANVVAIDPRRFSHCPDSLQNDPDVRQACITGWIERTGDGELVISELSIIPDFVRQAPGFHEVLEAHFPDGLTTLIRRPPKSYAERLNRFKLEEVLPATAGEPERLALERAVNAILTNDSANFSDEIFSSALRQRDDFPEIRKSAWKDAITAQPPLYFALPKDLKSAPDFMPLDGEVSRLDMDQWEYKVREKPWLLTQQNGVPKSIRYHLRILEAYRDGWIPYLEISPWRVWVKRGKFRRVYMSYALLCDSVIVDAFSEGWLRRKKTALYSWDSGSYRMRDMPVIQLAALRAYRRREGSFENTGIMQVVQAIAELHREGMSRHKSDPYIEEVRSILIDSGMRRVLGINE